MHPLLLCVFVVAQTVAAASSPRGLVEDVRRFESAQTNEVRFEVLTSLLDARSLPYAVEPFTIEKPVGREPRTEGRNVVVSLGAGAEELVIGAHYDAARLPDGTLSRGAVDNAASSVLLVRLAEVLRSEQPSMRIRIVWFDMEELGLIGSAQYLQRHATDRIVAMLNFDINAYGNTVLFGPSEREDNADLRRTFLRTCSAEDVPCVGFPQMPPGDDRSFTRRGVPTISVAMLPAVETHQLWLIMNAGANTGLAPGVTPPVLRTIHTSEDAASKVDEQTMTRALQFALSLVRNIGRR
jgi:Zn-dependent M28 family amino/carboxypeptidase